MFAQRKTSPEIQIFDAFVPRGLISSDKDPLNLQITPEGLVPLRIQLGNGVIKNIEAIKDHEDMPSILMLPRFVEPHAHIDKAFTWGTSPNLLGTYEGAMNANLEEYKQRTTQEVRLRAEKSLNLALRNGIRAIRTHIDSFDMIGAQSWDVFGEIKKEWKALIEMQCVALVPIEYWTTQNGKNLASKVAEKHGLLGGVISPPYQKKILRNQLRELFSLANDFGCGIDLHIDETSLSPGAGLRELLYMLDQINLDVPLTCSHLSSMALIEPEPLKILADRLAYHDVSVVALPLTNFWLLSRDENCSPLRRPLAPIKQLQMAGVTVAIGGDNVQDPWFPAGNFDPLALMSTSMSITHSAPWNRLGLSLFTTGPARLMDLKWDGTFKIGCAADLILIDAENWSAAMSTPPSRKVMVNGQWITHDTFTSLKN